MIRSVLSSTKPVADAANPERELSRAMTTGMSAPPIGMTASRPSRAPTPTSAHNQVVSDGSATTVATNAALVIARATLTIRMPPKPPHFSDSFSLKNAITEPVKVTAPMSAVAAAAAEV